MAPTCRVLYLETPKVASTAMLWFLSEAEADDGPGPSERSRASVLGSTPALAIHDPVVHGLPGLGDVRPELRREALSSPSWARLGITRDPFSRFFSAWQHRQLLRGGSPRFDPPPFIFADGELDVGASFRAFARFAADRWDLVTLDHHFVPQVEWLCLDRVEFTHLSPISDLDRTVARLAEHSPLLDRPFPAMNDGLGLDHRRCYDAATVAVVAELYRDDFASLGYPTAYPTRVGEPLLIDAMGQRLLAAAWERGERFDQLRKGMGIRWELVRQRHAITRSVRRLRSRR